MMLGGEYGDLGVVSRILAVHSNSVIRAASWMTNFPCSPSWRLSPKECRFLHGDPVRVAIASLLPLVLSLRTPCSLFKFRFGSKGQQRPFALNRLERTSRFLAVTSRTVRILIILPHVSCRWDQLRDNLQENARGSEYLQSYRSPASTA